jgi:glyoxylase-like metal-dependent hydrolase (beta-lactamase superfamily II)
MITLASGLSYFDLEFERRPRIIATVAVHTAGGVALVDPGPSTTLPTLRASLAAAGIAMSDVTDVLLTHIHLDHAGATGTLLREYPRLRVFVHEKGAPHMISPDKLLASAARLYGDAMNRLWGEVLPVPASALKTLQGGERITAGGRTFDVEYTPGHASHHVSFFDRDSGVALVGDTAGVKLTPDGYVMPPTPPPDVDLDVWQDSLARIERWRPLTLFLTHFGPSAFPGHLQLLREHIDLVSSLAKASLAREGTDDERADWFAEEVRRELRRRTHNADTLAYELAGRFDLNWRGLARYWRKRPQEALPTAAD